MVSSAHLKVEIHELRGMRDAEDLRRKILTLLLVEFNLDGSAVDVEVVRAWSRTRELDLGHE